MKHTLTRNTLPIAHGLSRKACLVLMERIRQLAQDEGHACTFSGHNGAMCLSVAGVNTYLIEAEHG